MNEFSDNEKESQEVLLTSNSEGFLSERTYWKWFTRFWEGNFNLFDENCPGQTSDCNEKAILVLRN